MSAAKRLCVDTHWAHVHLHRYLLNGFSRFRQLLQVHWKVQLQLPLGDYNPKAEYMQAEHLVRHSPIENVEDEFPCASSDETPEFV